VFCEMENMFYSPTGVMGVPKAMAVAIKITTRFTVLPTACGRKNNTQQNVMNVCDIIKMYSSDNNALCSSNNNVWICLSDVQW